MAKGFGERISARGDEVLRRGTQIVNQVARVIHREAVDRTPVDTGRAKYNWTVATGEKPPRRWVEPAYPGSKGSTSAENSQVAYSQAVTALQGRVAGTPIYIANFTPYIMELENGTASKQAPAGMAKQAVVAGRFIAAGAGPLLKGP